MRECLLTIIFVCQIVLRRRDYSRTRNSKNLRHLKVVVWNFRRQFKSWTPETVYFNYYFRRVVIFARINTLKALGSIDVPRCDVFFSATINNFLSLFYLRLTLRGDTYCGEHFSYFRKRHICVNKALICAALGLRVLSVLPRIYLVILILFSDGLLSSIAAVHLR